MIQEQILRFFQEISTPFIDRAAENITMLGEEYFFIVVIGWLYWNISKREGFKLSAAVIFSAIVNEILKVAFHTLRPFEKLDYIKGKRISTANGYSFPSGHTQGATAFFITLAQIVRQRWFSIIAIIMLLLVGLSRIYLGVHWPVDVIGGIVLGIVLSYFFCHIIDSFYDEHAKLRRIFFRLQSFVILITIALFLIDLFLLKGSMEIEGVFKVSGLSAGLVYGFFIEERYINFSPADAVFFKKLLRFIIGIAVCIGFMAGLKAVLPKHYIFDFIRYVIIGLWAIFLWPAMGLRLHLFNKESRV